jgi:hypothetical protein
MNNTCAKFEPSSSFRSIDTVDTHGQNGNHISPKAGLKIDSYAGKTIGSSSVRLHSSSSKFLGIL